MSRMEHHAQDNKQIHARIARACRADGYEQSRAAGFEAI